MKNPGMTGAVALVGIGLITIGLSNFVKAPQAHAAPVMSQSSGPKMIGIALDHGRGSGRWNKTLLAVDSEGKVYSLNTTATTSKWESFTFSP